MLTKCSNKSAQSGIGSPPSGYNVKVCKNIQGAKHRKFVS